MLFTREKIIDIFNPEDPVEIAAYDTYPQGDGSGYVGCWGAYPFTDNHMVYASDMQNGLYVFNFDPIYAGWIEGYIYSNAGDAISNASFKSVLNNRPINGETIPPVKEVTTCLKAAPITKPTAISIGLPFIAKSLNSLSIIPICD